MREHALIEILSVGSAGAVVECRCGWVASVKGDPAPRASARALYRRHKEISEESSSRG